MHLDLLAELPRAAPLLVSCDAAVALAQHSQLTRKGACLHRLDDAREAEHGGRPHVWEHGVCPTCVNTQMPSAKPCISLISCQAIGPHGDPWTKPLQAAESAAGDKTYGSLDQVPGTIAERQAVDEERHASAALYGLAASPAGAAPLLDNDGAAVKGATCSHHNGPVMYWRLARA